MNIFGMIAARRKRSAIRKYITYLGPALASRYGKLTYYSPERVRQAIQQEQLSEKESEYALVIYCSPKAFAADQQTHGGKGRTWEAGTSGENLSFADQDAHAGY